MQELPKEMLPLLARRGVRDRSVRLVVSTDINFAGQYAVMWLICSESRVLVFEEGREEPQFELDLAQVESVRTTAAVGSGLLELRMGGVWLSVVRYSNRLQFLFEKAARRIDEIRLGERLSVLPEQDPQRCPNCGMMLEFVGELCPRCISHRAALKRMSLMIRPYWRPTFVMLALLFVGIALDMAWPLLTRFLVDHVLKEKAAPLAPEYSWLARYDSRRLLRFVVGALAGVHVVRAVINVFTARIASRIGNLMTFDVRSELVRKLEQLDLAYYSRQETGSLVGRVAYDTEAIQSFLGQITSGFVMQFLLVIFSFAMMLSLEPALAFWAALPAPFVIGGAVVYWRYVHPRYQRFWDRSSKQAGLLNGILSGIRVVKAFAQEAYELRRFEQASDSVRRSRNALDFTAAFFYPFMGIVFQMGGWIIWYVGGEAVLGQHISLGTLMAFFGYLSMFYGPLGNLTNLTTWLTQFSTQVHRILEILDAPTVLPESLDPVPLEEARGEIEFREVTFSYSRGSPVLHGISLRIRPGEQVGIVGRSGSGKTSLVNLLYRFYDVDDGVILLDGVDIRTTAKDDLRRQISIVLQEPFLFRGTLAENIAYGWKNASKEELILAARAANAHDFILQHILAYDTSVGERGQELSGGERQRISIARALLRESPILVLDEATSAIDSESELLIRMALAGLTRKRTTILIAHRLSTLEACDRIYVIDHGRVAESGSHRELMALGGLYAGWVRIQQGRSYIETDEANRFLRPAGSAGLHLPDWLEPGRLHFFRGEKRDLRARKEGGSEQAGLFVLRCFPVECPEGYLSVRYSTPDGQVAELGLLRRLSDWPAEQQAILQEALAERYLFHRIERLLSVRKFSHFLSFVALTNLGRVEFVVRYEAESVKAYGERGRLLLDVEDNIYLLPDLAALARAERDLFDRYIYW